jgi:hypothetical protein
MTFALPQHSQAHSRLSSWISSTSAIATTSSITFWRIRAWFTLVQCLCRLKLLTCLRCAEDPVQKRTSRKVRSGSDSVILRCWLDVRFARKRTRPHQGLPFASLRQFVLIALARIADGRPRAMPLAGLSEFAEFVSGLAGRWMAAQWKAAVRSFLSLACIPCCVKDPHAIWRFQIKGASRD